MRLVKRERVGWTVAGRHYRLRSARKAAVMRCIDAAGEIFFRRRKKAFPASARRIAVIQLDHVGDMLLAGCFLSNLKAAFHGAAITVIGRTMSREAAAMLDGADEFVCCNTPWLARDDSAGWPAMLLFAIRNYRRFDLAFDLHGDPRHNILARCIGRFSAGFGFRGLGFLLDMEIRWQHVYSKHVIEMQCEMLHTAGIAVDYARNSLRIPETAMRKVRQKCAELGLKENCFFLIQMSSGRRIKDWPPERWEQLVRLLSAEAPVVCADRDAEKAARAGKGAAAGRFFTLTLTLAEYAALVSMCRRLISVDTFAVHLAAMLQKPLTAIYSGTNLVAEWGPFGAQYSTSVIQDTRCDLFPCHFMHDCPYGYPSPCMARVSAETVMIQW